MAEPTLAVVRGTDLPVDSFSDVLDLRSEDHDCSGKASPAGSDPDIPSSSSPPNTAAAIGGCKVTNKEETEEATRGGAPNWILKREQEAAGSWSDGGQGDSYRRSSDGEQSRWLSASPSTLISGLERMSEVLKLRSGSRHWNKKLITVILLSFTSLFRCNSKKKRISRKILRVMSISLLGLILLILVMGPLHWAANRSFGMRSWSNSTTFTNSVWSHGRMLLSTNHGKWAEVTNSSMISVDLMKMTQNADGSGQQKHDRSSHSEIQAVLYVQRNGKYVQINCNLIADEKALAHWISNNNSDQTNKDHEDATEMQNATDKPHLPVHKEFKTGVLFWIAIASAILVVLCSVAVLLWYKCGKTVQQNEQVQAESILQPELWGPRIFQRHELAAATNNFSYENKIGRGGFGPVYRGYLSNQDRHVAIKLLSQESSKQGQMEFQAEVKVMTQLRHRNIVQLLGWCHSSTGLLLVYELMAQGSLDKHLYDPERMLTWQQRQNIALGLGSSLLYLHQDCEKCIVHGDIKPANIMLDASLNAKLGDFGLARLIEHGAEPQTTQVVAGTHGYIDPEFINNHWRRTELDVYSFGVVLLEIACGKRPASRQPNGATALLAWVRDLFDRNMILDAADRRLHGEFDQQQMERVLVTGIWCAHQDTSQRPSIAQAMDILRSANAQLPVLPAMRDAQHIRSLQEQVYDDLEPDEDPLTTYLTSKDSVSLLAEG